MGDQTTKIKTSSALVSQFKIEEYNKKKLIRDVHKILGDLDQEKDAFKPSITTINKVFKALDRFSAEEGAFKDSFNFISTVLKRCVFCKSVDVPQVLIEQIQASNGDKVADEILKANEVPYFSINSEFLNSLNVVIRRAQKMENVHLQKIS